MAPGYYTRLFDSLRDLDLDGCSISLHVEIKELVNGDFNDHTTILDPMLAPVSGIGITPRTPAIAAGNRPPLGVEGT
jgi:hypothetical protein